ncbi:MAG TPA: hypothetical protein VI298_02330 [Geobacteraceae bacterium]
MRKVFLLAGLCFLPAPVVHAGVPVIATEGNILLDAARFPPSLRVQVELVNTKCTTCHSLERVIEAIDTGRTSTGVPFDKYFIRSLIIKKKRNPAANFTAEDARAIIRFFGDIQNNPTPYTEK